jgi:hypothetical protein
LTNQMAVETMTQSVGQQSHTATIVGTGDPLDEGCIVEFRLLYSGQLLGAHGGKTRSAHKHAIRREFHPQLKRLWTTNQNLRRRAAGFGIAKVHNMIEVIVGDPTAAPVNMDHTPYLEPGFAEIAKNWTRQGYNFVPLVTTEFCLRCSIEILFLRPSAAGQLFHAGDIDNRLKTLFDAFRLPLNGESVDHEGPGVGEDPFFCLLEDDKLITEVKVTTDTLLLLPHERVIGENDGFLVITVRLNPTIPGPNQWVYA